MRAGAGLTVAFADQSAVAIGGASADIVVVQFDRFLPLRSAGHRQDVCELNCKHPELRFVAVTACACSADGLQRGEKLACAESMNEGAF